MKNEDISLQCQPVDAYSMTQVSEPTKKYFSQDHGFQFRDLGKVQVRVNKKLLGPVSVLIEMSQKSDSRSKRQSMILKPQSPIK